MRYAPVVLAVVLLTPQISQAATVFWADFGNQTIRSADGDGTDMVVHRSAADYSNGVFRVRDLAVAPTLQRVYWNNPDNFSVEWSNLDGSNYHSYPQSMSVIAEGGMAIDESAGKLYWATFGAIHRMNLDGTGIENLDIPIFRELIQGIALDLVHGKLYFAAFRNIDGNPFIARANLDGSNPETVIAFSSSNYYLPSGIAIDPAQNVMYWSDVESVGGIHRFALNGSGDTEIVSGLGDPFRLALDSAAGKLYWTDAGLGVHKVQRANLDGTGIEDIASTGLEYPNGIGLVTVPEPASDILAVCCAVALAVAGRLKGRGFGAAMGHGAPDRAVGEH